MPLSRSETMARVKSCDTAPERLVRSIVHKLGYRFRLHRRDLPGKPDLTLSRLQGVIFVHGCFWHQHSCKRGNRVPTNNRDYWIRKLKGNIARDAEVIRKLKRQGWRVLFIWECETQNPTRLRIKLKQYLDRWNEAARSAS